jgi:hypothetical protein
MEISHTIYVITALYHFSCVTACTCILQLDHQVTFSRIQNMQKRLYLHYSYVCIKKPTHTMHI